MATMVRSSAGRMIGRRAECGGTVLTHMRRVSVVAVAAIVVLAITDQAAAWGPATHVRLAADVLSHVSLLPAAVAALIIRNRRAFFYGNVATDTVFAKKMSRIKQICHHWATGFDILESATTDEGRAFGYGYIAHLAADTVAHNKFLPRQIAVSRSTVGFGHVYWEVRADSLVEARHWRRLQSVLRGDYAEPPELLRARLIDTLLSFKANQAVFKRMNLLASERAWRRSVEFWSQLSRHDLSPAVVADYHAESIERNTDVKKLGRRSPVLHEDPNGNAALSYAKAQRKQLRQLKRAGIPHRHIIEEAAAGHAPTPRRVLVTAQPS